MKVIINTLSVDDDASFKDNKNLRLHATNINMDLLNRIFFVNGKLSNSTGNFVATVQQRKLCLDGLDELFDNGVRWWIV